MTRQWLKIGTVLTIVLICLALVAGSTQAHAAGPSGATQLGGIMAAVGSGARSATAATPAATGQARLSTSAGGTQPSAKLNLAPYSLPSTSGSMSFDSGSLVSLGAKFAIVLVLLLVCLRVLKYVMPGGRRLRVGKPNPMVLHSEPLGDKHKVCLLDLGDSIVVIGVSASGVSPITTIGGSEEVERLRKRYAPAQPAPVYRQEVDFAEQPSFSNELAEAETSETQEPVARHAQVPSVAAALPRQRRRSTPRLQDVLRQRFLPATEPPGDPGLSSAVGRMRELRQRIDRA